MWWWCMVVDFCFKLICVVGEGNDSLGGKRIVFVIIVVRSGIDEDNFVGLRFVFLILWFIGVGVKWVFCLY